MFKCNESEACVASDDQISKKLYIEVVQPGFLTNSKLRSYHTQKRGVLGCGKGLGFLLKL